MSRIFISYRRDDSADVTGRIFDRLAAHFTPGDVFRDLDGIPLGSDFRQHLRDAVDDAVVVLAVVGPGWTGSHLSPRRIDDPRDFVRIEVEAALEKAKPLIPLLVRNAVMPGEDELPISLQPFAFRNGIRVRTDPDFHPDVDRLIAQLEKLVGVPARPAAKDATNAVVVCPLGRGHFRTINEALDVVPDGSRVLVRPGLYRESVRVDRPLELVGDGPREDIFIIARDRPCLVATAAHAVVAGFSFRGLLSSSDFEAAAVEITGGALHLSDCVVTSEGLAGVRVRGADANPHLKKCRLRDGRGNGLIIDDGAQGIFEDCEIAMNAVVGIDVLGGANPHFRGCTVRENGYGGLRGDGPGRGTFEDCVFVGNRRSGVYLRDGANPVMKRCTVRGGSSGGVYVADGGRGRFEDCEVGGHLYSEVAVKRGGWPSFLRCRMRDGKAWGVFIDDGGDAEFERCDVLANGDGGVTILGKSHVVMRKCFIRGNRGAGVTVAGGSEAAILQCDLRDNAGGAWSIEPGCEVHREQNRE